MRHFRGIIITLVATVILLISITVPIFADGDDIPDPPSPPTLPSSG